MLSIESQLLIGICQVVFVQIDAVIVQNIQMLFENDDMSRD